MKKIITLIGISGMLCLFPFCKKENIAPKLPDSNVPLAKTQNHMDSAMLYVTLDSKPCSTPQEQYTSATVDIRGIQVFNTVQGWEDLIPVPGAWDVVSLQTAPVPVAELSEQTWVHAGAITKIKLTFGDNNQLVVNDAAARCYMIGAKEVVLDMEGELHAGTLNQIVVSIDICGNISVQTRYDQEPCYTLNPVMAFQSFSVISEN